MPLRAWIHLLTFWGAAVWTAFSNGVIHTGSAAANSKAGGGDLILVVGFLIGGVISAWDVTRSHRAYERLRAHARERTKSD